MVAGAIKSGCQGQVTVVNENVRGLRDLTTDQLATLSRCALREYAARFPGGREVPLPEGVSLFTTTDLALAAYLDMRGVPVVGVRPSRDPRASVNQAAEFVCADYQGAADRLSLKFVSSEAAEHDNRVRTLKREAIRMRDSQKKRD